MRSAVAGRSELIGRRRESETVNLLVEGVRAGRGGALVVRGEAGIGKSALLDSVRTVPGVRVLRVGGVEFETELAFAAVHQLCAPTLDGLGKLPAPQLEALSAAFGLGGEGVPDRFRVGLAVLGLLSETAAKQPLLCVVDDAQWLDQASAQTLAFAARRVQNEPVAFVFATRELDDRRELAGLPELPLQGLAEDDARNLLNSRIRAPLDGPVRERIIAEARGNPLALLELPRTAELAGGFGLPDAVPASGKVEASFRTRLRELPDRSRLLLLVAAAETTGDPVLLWRAAESLGINAEAAMPAEDADLVSLGLWVRFRHPLVRSTVYQDASPADRRAVHGALAQAMADSDEPDRWAWHRSQAAAGPDAGVAEALARSAGRAQARGGIAAAAAFLEAAARLTPEPVLRAERALAAAGAKRDTGAVEAALDLLAAAGAGRLDDQLRARTETLRARIAFDQYRNDAAVVRLQKAAQLTAPLDAASAREIFLETLAAAVFVGRFVEGPRLLDTAEAARAVIPALAPARPLDLLLDGLTTQARDGFLAAAPLLRGVVDSYLESGRDEGFSPGELWLACSAAMDLWDDAAWRTLADRQIRSSRATGALAVLPVTLSYRALAHIHAGEFDDAGALIDEAYVIAAEVGAPGLDYVDVSLAAWRGDEERTTGLAEAALRGATARGEGRLVTAVEYAQAVLFNGLGRPAAALDACRAACDLDEMGFHAWIPVEYVEAAVRSGNRELAVPVLEKLTERTAASPTDWAVGVELRSRALLTEGPKADDLYREAIDRLDRSEARAHAARARLLHGEWLRRGGHRLEARTQLRAAHDMLTSIGADAFAVRAAHELGASGEHPRKRRAGANADQLTAQEFQIARLVATGATSREVGSQLFLSPRTIDAHLRNIFKKLSITSRRQLRDMPLAR
ncbi:AAA family ATPase [Streptomyces sp. NPDC059460]|uniref:helix-turn-helix transcriptional regulator n=1 Tax=Streptomyces sp. NPDC059460 TaxID=3346840 RepID=UPI0036916894